MLNWWDHPDLGLLLVATEACVDGLDRPMAGYILDSLKRERLVLVVRRSGLRLLGPPDRQAWAAGIARKVMTHDADASGYLKGPGGGTIEVESP
jgi:hypothetical protein